jgi:arginine decarboxylase
VNQLREVVEEILDAGIPYQSGLEVGSKAEIFAAIAVHSESSGPIICNGYKDENYVRTALLGSKLGKTVILVIEKLSELEIIIRLAQEMKVEPEVGLRVRLVTEGSGNWARSGGEQAKFGLSTPEIIRALQILEEAGLKHCFRLIHFHIGSQIPDIQTIKNAVREASRYYAKLKKKGYQIEYLDVGGGLAVDYDGSQSSFHSSMNYSVEEYARDVVYNIKDICLSEDVTEPTIISESGRAQVAYHSVLVVRVFGSTRKVGDRIPPELPDPDHKLVKDLVEIENNLNESNLAETWHDLIQIRSQSNKMFDVGILSLEAKASIEMLFWNITEKISGYVRNGIESTESLEGFEEHVSDQHICNFSVFQSLLDHWALGQVFPVVPLHRLDEKPSVQSTLVDITCDSDGKVTSFIDLSDLNTSLPLHQFGDDPYYLGIFLTGAYQDIMGDIHNLFGRVNEIHVFLDRTEPDNFYIEEKIRGNSIADVLSLTQFNSTDLVKRLKTQVDQAIREKRIRPSEGVTLIDEYNQGLQDQTYLVFTDQI